MLITNLKIENLILNNILIYLNIIIKVTYFILF